jgi:hypothetical protein
MYKTNLGLSVPDHRLSSTVVRSTFGAFRQRSQAPLLRQAG